MKRALFGLVLLAGCDLGGPRPTGLGDTDRLGGPIVVWDLDRRPLAEIPLPNDQATRLDGSSPTGRRLNVGIEATTRYESRLRALFDTLDGFGAYAPVTVSFDQSLALDEIVARHGANDDFRDDAIFLLNVDRDCARFGEEVALDVGSGRFPVTLMGHTRRVADPLAPDGYRLDESDNKLFELDPDGESLNLLFPDRGEDANFLDPHACDAIAPSTVEHDRCVADNLVTWYERATNTLTLRPIWPLEERCTYAVVLTKRLHGLDGKPVESPFVEVQSVDQIAAVAPIRELLPRYGLGVDDVAFTWSFTVGTMTKDVELIRAGLYGSGPLARLATEFPTSSFDVWTRNQWRELTRDPALPADQDTRMLAGGCTTATVAALAGTNDGDKQICGGYADFAAIGGVFGGRFDAPNFLVDKHGRATPKYPADGDEVWDIDAEHGRATYGATEVSFFCALPREDARPPNITCKDGNPDGVPWCKPYPVVFFAHGYGSFKGEFLLHAGRHAQMGMAACGLDSFGHGTSVALDPGCPAGLQFAVMHGDLAKYGVPELANLIFSGRDRDLNNDGCADGGADQWTANLFHTRDVVRQSVVEEMQFVRILHAIDGKSRDADGNVLGDVDGDGTPDLGGATNITAAWGISLGGQLTGVLAGAEPALDVVVPNAAGAGLGDIAIRLGQGGLAEAVMLPIVGPMLVACLPQDAHDRPLASGTAESCLGSRAEPSQQANSLQAAGELRLAWYAADNTRLRTLGIASVAGVVPGDLVRIENLDKHVERTVAINARGWARTSIAADALPPQDRRPVLGLTDDDYAPYTIDDTTRLGDRIRITILDGASQQPKAVLESWQWSIEFQGAIYSSGQRLVALQEGLGYSRNTPELRRYYGLAAHAISAADPAVWSRRYVAEPFVAAYDPAAWPGRTHVLVMPTVGDPNVPAATGVAMGRTAGLLGAWDRDLEVPAEHGWRRLFVPDPRYGMSIDRWLVTQSVVEGDWRFQRFAGLTPNPNVLFDPDNISDGTAAFSCRHEDDWSAANGEFRCPAELDDTPTLFGVPYPAPGQQLRQDWPRPDGTFDAFRIPLLRPAGQHGIYNPQPFRAFDADAYMVSFVARYMASRARDVSHEPGCDCAYAARPVFEIDGMAASPGLENVTSCPDGDRAYGHLCSPACTAAWGLPSIPPTRCTR